MKQTAVEWLFQELDNYYQIKSNFRSKKEILKQAKEIEKQQIIDAYIECKRQYVIQENCYPPQFVVEEAEHYYKETFEKPTCPVCKCINGTTCSHSWHLYNQ